MTTIVNVFSFKKKIKRNSLGAPPKENHIWHNHDKDYIWWKKQVDFTAIWKTYNLLKTIGIYKLENTLHSHPCMHKIIPYSVERTGYNSYRLNYASNISKYWYPVSLNRPMVRVNNPMVKFNNPWSKIHMEKLCIDNIFTSKYQLYRSTIFFLSASVS